MKAVAVTPARREIGIVDHAPPPAPEGGQVRLRILEVGICGTDREIGAFEYGTPPPRSDYLVLGHEALGRVEEVGPGVAGLAPGDLVVPMVRRPCSHDRCRACRSRQAHFCETGDFTERGIKEAHGFLAEQVLEEESYLVRAPEDLRDVAVLAEPLTIAEKAMRQVWDIQERLPWGRPAEPGQAPRHCRNAVVLGAGPVGMLGAMKLVLGGFDTYVCSRRAAGGPKSIFAESIGATYVSTNETPLEELAERVGNIDLVYEAAGAVGVSYRLLALLGTNGIFVFTGIPGRKAPIDIEADDIMRNLVLRNQVVFGTVNAGRESYEAAVRDLAAFRERWPDALRSLITARHPMEKHRELILERPPGIKHVIAVSD